MLHSFVLCFGNSGSEPNCLRRNSPQDTGILIVNYISGVERANETLCGEV
jgi:hypothetical protein